MPFTKIRRGKQAGKYRSPSGRVFSPAQVRMYYATSGFTRDESDYGVMLAVREGGYQSGIVIGFADGRTAFVPSRRMFDGNPDQERDEHGRWTSGAVRSAEETHSDYELGAAVKAASGGTKAKAGDDVGGSTLTRSEADRVNRAAEVLQSLASSSNSGHAEVYRGMALPEGTDVGKMFPHNSVHEFKELTATSHDKGVALKYTDPQYAGEEKATSVLLRISQSGGVRGHNVTSGELAHGETLLPGGSKFRVSGSYKEGDVHVVRLHRSSSMKDWDPDQHPRGEGGRFGAGGGGEHHASVAEKLHAARDFVASHSAKETLSAVARSEAAKEALSVGLQSLLSHATGLDASTWTLNEQLVEMAVHHFSDVVGVTMGQARDLMTRGVDALIRLRQKRDGLADAADDVLEILFEIRRALRALNIADAEWDESQHPRGAGGKFGEGGGGKESNVNISKPAYTDKEKSAIESYLDYQEFQEINNALRSGDRLDDEQAATARSFASVIDKSGGLREDQVFHRGVSSAEDDFGRNPGAAFLSKLEKMKPGDEYVDRGFMATSTGRGAASDYGPAGTGQHGAMIEIRASAGDAAAHLPQSHHSEYVFQRGTTLKLISREDNRYVFKTVASANDSLRDDWDPDEQDEEDLA